MNYRVEDHEGVVHVVEPWTTKPDWNEVVTFLCRPFFGVDVASFKKYNWTRVDDTVAVNCIACLVADGGTQHGG